MITINDETHTHRGVPRKPNRAGGAIHSPAEWVPILKAAAKDTHELAWGASVIMWDNDGYGLDLSPLEALCTPGLYDREQVHRPTAELVAFLHKVGYPDPEGRCILAEDAFADRKKNGRDHTSNHERTRKADKRRWAPVEHGVGRL